MVCDVSWAPPINAGVDTTLNSSVNTWVSLVYHWASNQARGSHPYWSHNTPRMYQHRWKNTATLLDLTWDGVWYTMSSMFMGEVDTPLHIYQSKGIAFILATQPPKDVPWVDRWKLGHFHPLHWMMCDVPWAPTIYTCVDIHLNSSMDAWVRLIHLCTSNQTRR